MLEVRDLHVLRGSAPVLTGVTLHVARGERIAVMGSNGAGKSTLALALAGAIPISSGSITGPGAGAVRAVLQRPEASFLTERVNDEVALGDPQRSVSRARAMLEMLGLDSSFDLRDPLALSGGEQRRVAIAAVLASAPQVVVLDEPSAGLDGSARRALIDSVRALSGAELACVTITHDADEAARLAERLIVLDAGRIVWDGPLEPVLGDPDVAERYGIDVAPEVAAVRMLARARGVEAPLVAHPDAALELSRELVSMAPATSTSRATEVPRAPAQQSAPVDVRTLLRPAIDARPRIAATVAIVVAALVADTVVAAGAVAACALALLFAARLPRRQLTMVVRPLAVIAIALVVLQLALGRSGTVELLPGDERNSALLVALHRVAQIAGVMIATLLLTATTTASDLGHALRRLLRPLRAFGVRVDDAAMVIAMSLALVPSLDAELGRIATARDARGIRPRSRGILARIRADALLLGPLLVTSFRRAGTLADALTARGADPRAHVVAWRPLRVPWFDALLLGFAIMLALAAWKN